MGIRSLLERLKPTKTRAASQDCYQVLSPREIRLLRIEKNAKSKHGFEIQLTTVSLDQYLEVDAHEPDAPSQSVRLPATSGQLEFYALSYTWGHPDFHPHGKVPDPRPLKKVWIQCNGARLQIGQNLFDFLNMSFKNGHFQLSGSAKAVSSSPNYAGHIWIDAICINQADEEERAHQVSLMTDVYQKAKHVLVWLGPSHAPKEVLWVLEVFTPRLVSLNNAKKPAIQGKDPRCPDAEMLEAVGSDFLLQWQRDSPTFFDFVCRCKWFTRGWVLQEVLLRMPHDVSIFAGTSMLSWTPLRNLFVIMDDFGWSERVGEHLMKIFPTWKLGVNRFWPGQLYLKNVETLRSIAEDVEPKYMNIIDLIEWDVGVEPGFTPDERNSRQEVMKWKSYQDLIGQLRHLNPQFSLPKDYVYGYLGLARYFYFESPDLGIPIDYNDSSLTVEDLFTRFTAMLIQRAPRLGILGEAGLGSVSTSNSNLSLPSWVPDYSQPLQRSPLYTSVNTGLIDGLGTFSLHSFDLGAFTIDSPDPDHQTKARVVDRVLKMEGFVFDKVTELGVYFSDSALQQADWLVEYCLRPGPYKPKMPVFTEEASRPSALLETMLEPSSNLNSPSAEEIRKLLAFVLSLEIIRQTSSNKSSPSSASTHAILEQLEHVEGPDAAKYLPSRDEVLRLVRESSAASLHTPSQKLGDLLRQLQLGMQGRRVFVTAHDFIGLGPMSMEIGDEIWRFSDPSVPFILRPSTYSSVSSPTESYHQLVGEAYLHDEHVMWTFLNRELHDIYQDRRRTRPTTTTDSEDDEDSESDDSDVAIPNDQVRQVSIV